MSSVATEEMSSVATEEMSSVAPEEPPAVFWAPGPPKSVPRPPWGGEGRAWAWACLGREKYGFVYTKPYFGTQ